MTHFVTQPTADAFVSQDIWDNAVNRNVRKENTVKHVSKTVTVYMPQTAQLSTGIATA